MSSRSPAALDVALRPSRYLLIYLVVLAALALTAVLLLPVPVWARLAMTVALLIAVAVAFHRRVLLASPRSVIGLSYRDGTWLVRTPLQETAVDCRAGTVWPWLVALDLRAGRQRFPVLVLPDQLDPDSLRRLRQLAAHCW